MTSITAISTFDFSDMVFLSGNKIITTSQQVAKYFGKRHKDVLRAIRNLKCSDDFTRRNFAPIDFIDKNGDIQPMYDITRDGCMFLIMGFTGAIAASIKEAYINAFNWMADQLSQRQLMGEKAQHELVVRERASKVKGTIGSRLMNDRKKDIPILRREENRIKALTCPDLFSLIQYY